MSSTTRTVLALTGAIAMLFVISAVIGATLPARHRATSMAVLHQPPARIYALISDLPSRPTWRQNVTRVQTLPLQDGHPRWLSITDGGDWLVEAVRMQPPNHLTLASTDTTSGLQMQWDFDIEPQKNGTLVRVTEEGTIQHPVFRFIAKYVNGEHRTQMLFLQDLGAALGEKVQPQAL